MMTNSNSRVRRFGLALAGGASASIVIASTAWACTFQMGDIKICSPSTATCTETKDLQQVSTGRSNEGTKVKVTAAGLKVKPATYALYFATPSQQRQLSDPCHQATKILKSPTGVVLDAMRTDKYGRLDADFNTAGPQPYKAKLPLISSDPMVTGPGDYTTGICAREMTPAKDPGPNSSATAHATFTVIVI